jgi:hypothetical protein
MPYSEETASYKVIISPTSVFLLMFSSCHLQFNHTMLRIKDPNVSIPFYTDASFWLTLLSSIFILLSFPPLLFPRPGHRNGPH